MTEKFSHAEAQLAGAALDTLKVMDAVLEAPREIKETLTKASPSALYAYATDPGYKPDDNLLRLLATDEDARTGFQRLLENTSVYVLPQMAAASTGDIETREVEGCKIVFRPSRANPDQLYAIIEIANVETAPSMLFMRQPNGETNRITLPGFQNGRAQLLLERNSADARGLMDINTEVYLR